MIEDFVRSIRGMSSYKKQIVHLEEIPPQEAQFRRTGKTLTRKHSELLVNRKIQLYSHQAEAINKARQGKNVVIVTPTASGKTLAFNIPVLEALTKDKNATALYLYPTKALTNDQLKVLREMEKETGIDRIPKRLRWRHSPAPTGKHTRKLQNHPQQPIRTAPVPSVALQMANLPSKPQIHNNRRSTRLPRSLRLQRRNAA